MSALIIIPYEYTTTSFSGNGLKIYTSSPTIETMLETPHIVVGAAIAAKIPNPYIALPLAFASHFILEKVPHWNPHLKTETEKFGAPTRQSTAITIADLILAGSFGLFIAATTLPNIYHFTTVVAAMFFSSLPDLLEAPYFFLGARQKFFLRWLKFKKSIQADAAFWPGMATQLVTIIAAFWWIFS